MQKEQELKMFLDEILMHFKNEHYDIAIKRLEKTGKFIIQELNKYNNKH